VAKAGLGNLPSKFMGNSNISLREALHFFQKKKMVRLGAHALLEFLAEVLGRGHLADAQLGRCGPGV